MVLHLKETGITDDQIIEMNFESNASKKISSDESYNYVKQRIHPNKECTFSLMKYSEWLTGRTLLILFAWI